MRKGPFSLDKPRLSLREFLVPPGQLLELRLPPQPRGARLLLELLGLSMEAGLAPVQFLLTAAQDLG